jgi:hypothetical protein
MQGNALEKARAFLIRGLAVVAVVMTYVFSGVGAQVAGVVGVTGLTLFTTAKPAEAGYRYRRRRYRRRRYRRYGY